MEELPDAVSAMDWPGVVVAVAGVTDGPADPDTAVPVPVNAITCGDPVPLSVIVSVADSTLVVDGVNVIATVQLAVAASVVPQLLPSVKSAAFVPLRVIPLILNGPAPVFDKTTGCAGLVVAMV